MEFANFKQRVLLWGHLFVTLPAIAAILLVLLFRKYLYVPVWMYYMYWVAAGAAIGYQWYEAAMPRWRMALRRKGLSESEVEAIARQGGLVLPEASALGLFALHTSAGALCTILNLWLVGQIVHWVLPLIGASVPPSAHDFYLQHFELANVIPAFLLGYVIFSKFPGFGSWAWVLPTLVISYKLITFADPNVSVLAASSPWHRFSYYFVIARLSPVFYLPSDPERWLQQVAVVAPFYSSLAYSVGAIAMKTRALQRAWESLSREPYPEVIEPDESGIVDTPNDSVEEPLQRE